MKIETFICSTWLVYPHHPPMINYHLMSVYKSTVTERLVGGRKKASPILRKLNNLNKFYRVHPASKQRSEGEKVRVGDDLILVSVATERYLVSSLRHKLEFLLK